MQSDEEAGDGASALTSALLPPDAGTPGELEDARGRGAPRTKAASRPGLGLACVTSSVLLFALNNALVKTVALEPLVMLQVRSLLEWLFLSLVIGAFVPASSTAAKFFGEKPHRPTLFLRAGLYWGFVLLFWHAIANMPVGDATSLVFLSPFFTTFFGRLLLGEKVRSLVFGCLLLSLVGVALITQPTFLFGDEKAETEDGANYNHGMLFALAAAVVGSLFPVLTRKSRECHWATVDHVSALSSAAVLNPLALGVTALTGSATGPTDPASWEGLWDPAKLLLLVAVALLSFVALGLKTCGYQREKVAAASVMEYLEIPVSYALQYVIFGVLLTPTQVLGVGLVLASGLINLWLGL